MTARGALAALGLALVALALAPDPRALRADAVVRRSEAWLDPALRTPFASVLLRAPGGAALAPGDRVLGVRLPGDPGLRVPGDRAALLAVLASAPAGAAATFLVRGPAGERAVPVRLAAPGARRALAAQWPAAAAGALLLLFAGVCAIGGRHPVATPLAAVAGCLGAGVLGALDLALPGDGGVLGVPGLRARAAAAAWSLLPAALLHLAARFPVTMPRFRRRGLAALPWALWAAPAALAQLRFGEAAVGQAVERVALAASFLAGGILVAGCLRPGRRLTPIERVRARAAVVGLVAAGAGPLLAFGAARAVPPAAATALCLGALALPAALGWAVARYRLLDPPAWLPRVLLAGASAGVALGLGAAGLRAVTGGLPGARGAPAFALATALLYPLVRRGLARAVGAGAGARPDPEALVARAGRELAGAAGTALVVARLVALVREGLGAAAVSAGPLEAEAGGAADPLLAGAVALCGSEPPLGGVVVLRTPRAEDPGPGAPELALRIDARGLPPLVVAVAARPDGLPYASEERRALADAGRLAALALADALDAERLEREVTARTAALRRALEDRTALLAAAERIGGASEGAAVREAVAEFLAERGGAPVAAPAHAERGRRVVATVCRPPAARETLAVAAPDPERAADLQPQADTLCALADVALERLHLLDGLKREVERQAGELAAASAGRRHAEFVRRAAHELRKPGEEIRHLVAALAAEFPAPAYPALARIDDAACQLGRRLDALLWRQGGRPDRRRVDLVRLVDEAVWRAALLRERRYSVSHAQPRLPLLGDPVRLVSLVENLLDNAVRAAGEGGRVAVRTGRTAATGLPVATLEIEDDGPGVPVDLGEEIFEAGIGAFAGGCGLGLALCREVVSLHGGELAVESRPGRTVFRVQLPRLAGARS